MPHKLAQKNGKPDCLYYIGCSQILLLCAPDMLLNVPLISMLTENQGITNFFTKVNNQTVSFPLESDDSYHATELCYSNQHVAPPFFNDFLDIYLGPHSSKGDDAKDSRDKKREPVLEGEFTVSFRSLPLPVCY